MNVLPSQLGLRCFKSILNSLEAGSGPSIRAGLPRKLAVAPVLANRCPRAAAAAAAALPALPVHDKGQDAALDIIVDAGELRYILYVFACQERCTHERTSSIVCRLSSLLS